LTIAITLSKGLFACFGSSEQPNLPDAELPPYDASSPDDATAAETSTPPIEAGTDTSAPEASIDADAGVDATVAIEAGADAALKAVFVHVLGSGGPESGKTIVFQDTSGLVIATATTDAQGAASQGVPAGSQVTAILGTANAPEFVTFEGVAPGDVLTAIDGVLHAQSSVETFLPATEPPAGATSFLITSGPCSTYADGNQNNLTLFPNCIGSAGQFPVLVLAQGATGTVAYDYVKDNTFPLDGGFPEVTLPGAWSTAIGQETITANNPANGANVILGYSEVADGVMTPQSSSLLPGDGGTLSANFDIHLGYPDSVQAEIDSYAPTSDNPAVTIVSAAATSAAPPSQTTHGDAFDAQTLLPTIANATVDSTDLVRPTVQWTMAAPLSANAAVGAIASLGWLEVKDGSTDASGTWIVVSPAGAQQARVPALPPGVASGPDSDAVWIQGPSVVIAGGDPFPDYKTFRATGLALGTQIQPNTSPFIPPFAVPGTVRATVYFTSMQSAL
jgi:hypothetical protein